MRSLKFLLALVLVLALIPSYAFADNVKNVYKGVALVNLPEKNPNAKELEVPSSLKIDQYVFNGEDLSITGQLQYKNVTKEVVVSGEAFQSGIDSEDVIFNVTNENNHDGLEVVKLKLYNTPNTNELVANKRLEGEKTLTIYFFDKDERDLISFNVPAIDLGLGDLNGKDFEYSKSVTDAWVYKVMKGEIEEPSFTMLGGVNREDVGNVSGVITYSDPYGNGCDEQHSKSGKTSIIGSSIMSDGDYVDTNIKVTSQGITYNCGPGDYTYVSGAETAVWFGGYTNPVQVDLTFSGSSYVDFVKKTKWYGSYSKRPYYSATAGLSVGYGPISAGSSIKFWDNYDVNASSSSEKTVYFGGGDYSRKANFDFDNTRLYSVGNYYTTSSYIGVSSSSSYKTVSAYFRVPVYGNTGGTLYSTRTSSLSISYSNY
ncbi:hypothetical protein [Rossellomorea sp. NS-SX7]|uniref:hypothetical protein n=1 Tax=Rossellomorea sp. NS-SX7 TaxID=3463856 RepID=UPI004059AEB5